MVAPAPYLPRTVGRYEIVGRLAQGGMAEVLLGRLRGPHGFERPVVVKRILPHLAAEPAIVAMFLDEARIIASLRHPNLVQVQELAHDGNELLLAMEYLEGESLSGLCRRLARNGDQLPPALVAHIMAEACAGLHAAHEAVSVDGRPLELVHRDVSPQNIFVGYAGDVHVIDFGIAVTAGRIPRTEAGTVRGKFEYLAPEQLESPPLDRRVDVFALGVVLFELATGRRLYKRESQALTFMAILHDPVPDPAALRSELPGELVSICRRALAKRRDERFATAAEMRRELLAVARQGTSEHPGDALAALMRGLFEDRIAEKAEMLRRVRQGSEVDRVPDAEVDLAIELPTVAEGATEGVSRTAPTPYSGPGLRRRGWALSALAAGVVVVLSVGAGALAAHRIAQGNQATGGSSASPVAVASDTGSSRPVPMPVPMPMPVEGASATPAGPRASAAVVTAPTSTPPRKPVTPTPRRGNGPPRPAGPPASPAPTIW